MDPAGELRKLLRKRAVFLDGAAGTELMKRGMPSGTSTELWASEHLDVLSGMHRDYVNAGADIILTCTFGGTASKLGDPDLVAGTNALLAETALKEAGRALVGASIGPTGGFLYPSGSMEWIDAYNEFSAQASAISDTGINIYFLETFSDPRELKAAVLAVRDASPDAFISAQMTFSRAGMTMSGTSPTALAALMNQLPVDAMGVNCGEGPEELLPVVQEIARYSDKWIAVEPNAGLPVDGRWEMTPDRFAAWMEDFAWSGAAILGGCCGTGPDHVREYVSLLGRRPVQESQAETLRILTSMDRSVWLGKGLLTIGESINPTGRKDLQNSLGNGDFLAVVSLARAQGRADVIDVNLGLERTLPNKLVGQIFSHVAIGPPLSIDLAEPENIEDAFRNTGGIALLNSLTAREEYIAGRIGTLLRHGGYAVLLPIDENGLGESPEERLMIVRRGLSMLEEHGFPKERVIADPVIRPVGTGADPETALETLELLKQNGLLTVAGISNVSHGMPDRSSLNATYLAAMAMRGLDLAIVDVLDSMILKVHRSIRILSGNMEPVEMKLPELNPSGSAPDFMAILRRSITLGDRRQTEASARELLESGVSAVTILSDGLGPAMKEVGDLYSRRKIFLPHLISSAEASKILTGLLRPLLSENDAPESRGRVILASVKGDIHDIGKNLVSLFLSNSGFQVIDLGRDVSCDRIIMEAEENGADIIALSALMSTTAPEMERVIESARKRIPGIRVLVGGAVLTREYAHSIGANGYAPDAFEAVSEAERLMSLT